MSEALSDWMEFRSLVVADTKSIVELMDSISSTLRRAVASFEGAQPFDPRIMIILSTQQKLVNERLMAMVVENSHNHNMPDDAELYLMRAFKAQIEVMIMAVDQGIRQSAALRDSKEGS